MKILRAAAVLLCCLLVASPAVATTGPGGGGGTIGEVASVKKSGKTITATYTLKSEDEWSLMQITAVLTRTGGGHKQVDKYNTKQCGKPLGKGVTKCSVTIKINDVSGREHYFMMVYPLASGTFATQTSPGGSSHITCAHGIDCLGVHGVYQRNVYY